MNLVMTGGAGRLGAALHPLLPDAMLLTHAELDVRDTRAVWSVLRAAQADVILHGAAITDHQCPDFNALVETNVLGTRHVAAAATAFGTRLVYLSTHYVYPGDVGNYAEDALCRPIGAYAMTKWLAEWYALRAPRALVIRGSWFVPAALATWREAYTDAHTNREPVASAAKKIALLATRDTTGIVNIGGPRRTFYQLVREAGGRPVAASRDSFVGGYAFPRDSSVNTERYDELCRAF